MGLRQRSAAMGKESNRREKLEAIAHLEIALTFV
jgi:hypothetical protein